MNLLPPCSDDLYFFQDAGLNSTHLNELDLKRKYRQQALLALGPYLYPQTITHWVRVIGRQLGLGSADFSFQYACCTLSATSARCFKNGGAGSNSGDSEAWSLLATEFTSCVRRMKPEQTYALCLVVAGITPLGASKYSGCEMLFPLVPVPDLGVGILLSTIHAAVQKQAVPLAAGSTEATTPASTTSLYTLTAPLAHKLLPSVACIRNYLDAIRSSFSSSSPIRVELLRHCLDSSSALDDVFVSILLSDCCTGDAVMRLLKASVELDHAEEGRSQVISVGTPSSKTDAAIARVSAKSADRISLLLASTRVPPEGDNTSATATVLAAAECLMLNAHLNFGPVTAGNITRSLYKMIEESSTSLHPAANGDSVAEEEDRVTISHLDCCLAVTQALNTYLSKIKTESPPVEGTSELKEIGRTAGATTNELLVTRRTVTQLQLLVESDYWREDSSPVGRIEVGLVSSGSEHGGLESYYSLDSSEDREQLFLRVVSLASEVPPSEAVIAVRAIMRLLRCWGLSRSAGSLKVALEAPLSPVPLFSTTSVRTIPGTAYPSWMGNNFHLLSWGKVIEISCKNRLYLDILEVILIDIDTDPVCGHQPTGQSGGESTRYLAQTIGALAVDQTVPANYRHSVRHIATASAPALSTSRPLHNSFYQLFLAQFGLMAGGELAKQAARDLERDVLATTHSSSFSLSLFVLLLCLHDKEVVQTVARSSVLLAALVRLNSKCLEAR